MDGPLGNRNLRQSRRKPGSNQTQPKSNQKATPVQKTPVTKVPEVVAPVIDATQRFETHRQQAKEIIHKLLENCSDSSSDDEDDYDQDEERRQQNNDKLSKFLSSYSGNQQDMLLVKQHAEAKQHSCVVCLEKVRTRDSVWQCDQCYCLLHLPCTQKWARSIYSEETGGNVSGGTWPCPKCRMLYTQAQIPRSYYCFCGKQENPPIDLWLLPHTCGNSCGQHLKPECGHTCTLLCHPGPCPPCPQIVQATCFCGAHTEPKRCNNRHYSCQKTCKKVLPCKIHRCEIGCHPGECPPCSKERKAKCQCGAEEKTILCSVGDFHCERVCNKPLQCGHHVCEIKCHAGNCPPCPLEGQRKCHCGKVTITDILCTEPTPSCGDTCNKVLTCAGNHKCLQRCHPGECATCRVHVNKYCRCGQTKKSVQCYQDFTCEKKCNRIRNCKKHTCKKKCCKGDCPPCNEICGNRLPCGNHKCEAICHPGACFPCSVTVNVTCFCGNAVVNVPCGVEKRTKPPRCNLPCKIPPTCHHTSRIPHPCHFGPCPPCEQTCLVQKPGCYHKCKLPCHDPLPKLPTTQKLLKRHNPMLYKPIPEDEVRCPTCEEPVTRQCVGLHSQYQVGCNTKRLFPCGRECGNPLACGNHNCSASCHVVTNIRDNRAFIQDPNDIVDDTTHTTLQDINLLVGPSKIVTFAKILDLSQLLHTVTAKHKDTCPPCELSCQKPRNPPCAHKCRLPCHSGPCPDCKVVIRKHCHCPLNTLKTMHCCETHITQEEMDKLVCCGTECTRKMSCGHICNMICHPGTCRSASECTKRVKVQCKCRHKHALVNCNEMKQTVVECDQSCEDWKEKQALEKAAKEKQQSNEQLTHSVADSAAPVKSKKRKIRKVQEEKVEKKPNALVVKFNNFYGTITSGSFWKVVFVYSLPFLLIFITIAITLLRD